jgi:hypothetical protein
MSDVDDLLPLYRDDDNTRVRFVGGPCDGRALAWATGEPPSGIVLPVDTGPPTLADLTAPLQPIPKAYYRPHLDEVGQPSRDDDGTLVYECDGQ